MLELLRILLGSRLVTLPVPSGRARAAQMSMRGDWPEGDTIAWTDSGPMRSMEQPFSSRIF